VNSTNGEGSKKRDQLPPSAKYVLDVLEQEERLTRQEALARTGLCPATFDRAVNRLFTQGYLSKTRVNTDLRQVLLTLESIHDYKTHDT